MPIKLEEKQLKELDLIVSLISKYRSTNNNEERNELIKLLAQRHIITKGYLSDTGRKQIHPDDIEYIEGIYEDMNLILIAISILAKSLNPVPVIDFSVIVLFFLNSSNITNISSFGTPSGISLFNL